MGIPRFSVNAKGSNVRSLPLHTKTCDWSATGGGERAFADVALGALAALSAPPFSKPPPSKPLDTYNLPPPKHPLPPVDDDEGVG
jgi:hypothetical protein